MGDIPTDRESGSDPTPETTQDTTKTGADRTLETKKERSNSTGYYWVPWGTGLESPPESGAKR